MNSNTNIPWWINNLQWMTTGLKHVEYLQWMENATDHQFQKIYNKLNNWMTFQTKQVHASALRRSLPVCEE